MLDRRCVPVNAVQCIRRVRVQQVRVRWALVQAFRLPVLHVRVAVQGVHRGVQGSVMFLEG